MHGAGVCGGDGVCGGNGDGVCGDNGDGVGYVYLVTGSAIPTLRR